MRWSKVRERPIMVLHETQRSIHYRAKNVNCNGCEAVEDAMESLGCNSSASFRLQHFKYAVARVSCCRFRHCEEHQNVMSEIRTKR